MNLKEFDKIYGEKKGMTRTLGSAMHREILLDSGIFGLNIAHGIGGIKTGSVMQIMGPPGVGKSSIAYRLIADGLQKGMSALVVDTEGGYNEEILMDTLEDYGVDPLDPDIHFRYATATNYRDAKMKGGSVVQDSSKPVMTIEQIVPMIEEWIVSSEISPNGAVVVIDSLDFMMTDSQVGTTIDTATVALIARRMKDFLKKFIGTIRGTGSMIIFIHQVTSKIDPHARDTETFTGGNALKHASHFSLRLKDIGQEVAGDELVGRKIRGTIIKSKQGSCWRAFDYVIRHDCGPDNIGAVFEAAKTLNIIKVSGSWVTVPGSESPIQGKEAVRKYWMQNPDKLRYVENLVLDALKTENIDEVAPKVDEEE